MGIWLDGTESMRGGERAAQAAIGGDRVGPKVPTETYSAGAGCARFGWRQTAAANGAANWRQPPDCLSLAATRRRRRCGRPAARQDTQARQAVDRGRDRGARGGVDPRRSAALGNALDRAYMAGAAGTSFCSVQRIWEAHHPQPHRVRTCKQSHDPQFVDKFADIIDL